MIEIVLEHLQPRDRSLRFRSILSSMGVHGRYFSTRKFSVRLRSILLPAFTAHIFRFRSRGHRILSAHSVRQQSGIRRPRSN
jgi:hypothetical protein